MLDEGRLVHVPLEVGQTWRSSQHCSPGLTCEWEFRRTSKAVNAFDKSDRLDSVLVDIVLEFSPEHAGIIKSRLGVHRFLSSGSTRLEDFALERVVAAPLALPARTFWHCHLQNDVVRQRVMGHDRPPVRALRVEIKGNREPIQLEDLRISAGSRLQEGKRKTYVLEGGNVPECLLGPVEIHDNHGNLDASDETLGYWEARRGIHVDLVVRRWVLRPVARERLDATPSLFVAGDAHGDKGWVDIGHIDLAGSQMVVLHGDETNIRQCGSLLIAGVC